MTKVLVLDDGYHDKDIVMVVGNNTLLKMNLAYFITIHLAVPHSADYRMKTAHYEDLEDDALAIMFDHLNKMTSITRVEDASLMWAFDKLYNSDEMVAGCDIY